MHIVYSDELDSLKTLVEQDNFSGKTAKVETLILLAKQQFYNFPDQSVENGLKALETAMETNDRLLIAKAAKNIGILYYRLSEFANALKYLKLALKYNLEANNPDELAANYNNLGLIYSQLGNYNLALENHLKQLKINEETGNLKGLANSNLNIGNIYYRMNEIDKSLEYYRKSLEINEVLQDTNRMATTLINMGSVSIELHDYEQAIQHFNRALPIKMKYDDKTNLGKIYTNLGVAYNSMKEYPEAISYFSKSLEVSSEINNRDNMCVSMINLGDAYFHENEMEKSHFFLERALTLAREIDSKKLIRDIYEILSNWYEAEKNFETALAYYKSMTVLNDSLFNSEKSNQIKNLQIVYEVEKKEKEILEKDISIEKLKTSQFYLLLAIIVALSLAFIVYYRYHTKKRLNRELEIKIAEALQKEKEHQQIIVHKSSLTSLGELASGIAHEIKQPLQNISLVNEGLQLESTEEKIDNAFVANSAKDIAEGIKRIKFIVNEISNFSRGQQKEIMEWFNINTRIENAFSLARTKFSNRRIDVQFYLDNSIPEFQGNPYKFEQVVVNFFNNAKDAIEDKAEKSDGQFSKKMIVRSYLKDDFIHVEVEDNGTGIPESIKTKIFLPFFTTKELGKGTGLGLSISLGIAKEMGGFIDIESEENKGTLMRLNLPVSKS
ncbi:MAG: tetratricopeptide repeat-containing sensor histidine kinase [Bacteroidales bacterium]|nr:tetratricopeptide repeat-containing sensor histidine kinase [Bacteroidales bacterium]